MDSYAGGVSRYLFHEDRSPVTVEHHVCRGPVRGVPSQPAAADSHYRSQRSAGRTDDGRRCPARFGRPTHSGDRPPESRVRDGYADRTAGYDDGRQRLLGRSRRSRAEPHRTSRRCILQRTGQSDQYGRKLADARRVRASHVRGGAKRWYATQSRQECRRGAGDHVGRPAAQPGRLDQGRLHGRRRSRNVRTAMRSRTRSPSRLPSPVPRFCRAPSSPSSPSPCAPTT